MEYMIAWKTFLYYAIFSPSDYIKTLKTKMAKEDAGLKFRLKK